MPALFAASVIEIILSFTSSINNFSAAVFSPMLIPSSIKPWWWF